MKYILSILLLWNMSACGQRDTVNVPIPGSGRITDSGFIISGQITATATPTLSASLSIKFDTVRCIMLVCDTAALHIYYVGDGSVPMYHNLNVYWQYGYMILVDKSELLLTSGSMSLDVPKSYLDANKKPLDSNIVVWQIIQVDLKNPRLYIGMEKQSNPRSADFIISSSGTWMDTSATHTIYLKSGPVTYMRDNPPTLTRDANGIVIIFDTTK